MRRRTLLLLLLAAGCQKKPSSACRLGDWELPNKPLGTWSLEDHQKAAFGCITYNARKLAGGKDGAGDLASATVENCDASLHELWVALESQGDARPTFEELKAEKRDEAIAEIVDYRAKGCATK